MSSRRGSRERAQCSFFLLFVVVQALSRVRLFAAPWTAARQASLFFTVSCSFLKLTCIESVMASKHLILCRALLLLPLIFPSIRIVSSEWAFYIRWPKYWSFSFSTNLSSEYSGLISFRIHCFDLAVQEPLKSLLQRYSLKTSIILVLRLVYGSILTSVHDCWKNHSFECTELCW